MWVEGISGTMIKRPIPAIKGFYAQYFPVGDYLGEMFYAVWMVVVSIGILGAEGDITPGAVTSVVIIAFGVNIAWGLIDGTTVMYTNLIEKARADKLVYALQTKKDAQTLTAAAEDLDDGITAALSAEEKQKVLEMIASKSPGEDPNKKRYKAKKEDRYYALGILAIDTFLVVPIILPIIIADYPYDGVYASRIIATLIFAALGVMYAKELNRRRWLAALFLGTLCFSVFSLAFLAGW
jgi:hypothetical protein